MLDRAELHHRFGQLLAARGAGDARLSTSCAWPVTCSPGRRGTVPAPGGGRPGLARDHRRPGGIPGPLQLTDRERDVAVLVAKGMTNREVAAELYVSPKAVDYHLGHIYGKLGITSRRDLRQRVLN